MAQHEGTSTVAAPAAVSAAQPYATIMQRFFAQLVDALVVFGVFYFTGMQVAKQYGGLTDSGFDLTGRPAGLAILITGSILLFYFTFGEALAGATLGKAAVGLRVVNASGGGRLSLRQALLRNVLRVVDGLALYLIGAIVIMVTSRRQRLGDLAAGSIVLTREVSRAMRITTLILALAIAAGGVVASYRLPGLL
jgi:uncharacterized RDD family membrane protein YckC